MKWSYIRTSHFIVWGTCLDNRAADELAQKGAKLSSDHTNHFCGIPLIACKRKVEKFLYKLSHQLRNNDHTYQHTNDKFKTEKASRSGIFSSRLGIRHPDFCRSCQNIKMEETAFHILCHCPAFEKARIKSLGLSSFDSNCSWLQYGQ